MEITGRLVGDAKVHTLKDERKVVNFTVVVNDYFKPKGSTEGKQVALYIQCGYWISTAIAERLKKGSIVEVSGRLYVSAYTDSDGDARGSLHCHVNSIKVHGKGQPKSESASPQLVAEGLKEPLDDLPF